MLALMYYQRQSSLSWFSNSISLIDEAMGKLCIAFRKRRYPQTNEGRRRYILDSLRRARLRKMALRVFYLVIALCGITGVVCIFLWLILHEYVSSDRMLSFYILTCISLAFIAIGANGSSECKRRQLWSLNLSLDSCVDICMVIVSPSGQKYGWWDCWWLLHLLHSG